MSRSSLPPAYQSFWKEREKDRKEGPLTSPSGSDSRSGGWRSRPGCRWRSSRRCRSCHLEHGEGRHLSVGGEGGGAWEEGGFPRGHGPRRGHRDACPACDSWWACACGRGLRTWLRPCSCHQLAGAAHRQAGGCPTSMHGGCPQPPFTVAASPVLTTPTHPPLRWLQPPPTQTHAPHTHTTTTSTSHPPVLTTNWHLRSPQTLFARTAALSCSSPPAAQDGGGRRGGGGFSQRRGGWAVPWGAGAGGVSQARGGGTSSLGANGC